MKLWMSRNLISLAPNYFVKSKSLIHHESGPSYPLLNSTTGKAVRAPDNRYTSETITVIVVETELCRLFNLLIWFSWLVSLILLWIVWSPHKLPYRTMGNCKIPWKVFFGELSSEFKRNETPEATIVCTVPL